MATLKITVVPKKVLKDGTHKIRIAIGHKSETRYITTQFKIDDLSQFEYGQVVKHPRSHVINIRLRNLLNEYEDKLETIRNPELYTCAQLRDILINSHQITSAHTFQKIAQDFIAELIADDRESYAKLIEIDTRYFTEFTNGDFFLSEITPQIVNNYAQFLSKKKHLSQTSVGMAMRTIKSIINRAIKMQFVVYDVHPFLYYKIPTSEERELDISVDDLRRFRDIELPSHRLSIARDIFMLSYYLGGVNLIDLLSYDFRNTDRFSYIRRKSRNMKLGERTISITIQPEAATLISKYMNHSTGRLSFGYHFAYKNFSRYITRQIHTIAKMLNIRGNVVYYSARKSFVQHGFELGIPLEILEYCIGQSMKKNRPIFNYVRIMRTHADKAIRMILDNLKD